MQCSGGGGVLGDAVAALQAASSGWPSHLQPGYTEPPATVSTAYARGDWAALLPEDGSLAHHAVLVALHEAAGELRALLTMARRPPRSLLRGPRAACSHAPMQCPISRPVWCAGHG